MTLANTFWIIAIASTLLAGESTLKVVCGTLDDGKDRICLIIWKDAKSDYTKNCDKNWKHCIIKTEVWKNTIYSYN